jgi:hypothetical protein
VLITVDEMIEALQRAKEFDCEAGEAPLTLTGWRSSPAGFCRATEGERRAEPRRSGGLARWSESVRAGILVLGWALFGLLWSRALGR